MKKFNFKNGKEKLVEKTNNVKEKCVGYVGKYSDYITLGVIWSACMACFTIGREAQFSSDSKVVNDYLKDYSEGFNDILVSYNNMMKELTEMSKESN